MIMDRKRTHTHSLSSIILHFIFPRYFYAMYGNQFGLTLREEHRLRVFENTVLRRIFGPKTGRNRRLKQTA
jgi:hypothetical protein